MSDSSPPATEKTELVRRTPASSKASSAEPAGPDVNQDGPTMKVGEVIDALGVGRFQALMATFAGLLLLGESMGITLIGIVGRSIQCQWNLSNLKLAVFSLAIFIGFLLFCPLWGFLADQHGRRGILILGMAFTSYYMLISAVSPTYEWLVFLRTAAGAAMATTPQGMVYIVECCPATARAYLLNIGFVVWSIGPVLELAIALGLNAAGIGNGAWRVLVILSALPIIGSCGAYWVFPETPRYYLVHGRLDKCKSSLRRIAQVNGRESDFDWSALRITPEAKTAEAPQFKWLFSKRLRSVTLGLAAISFLTNFTYYGGVLFAQQLVQESGMSDSVTEVLQSSCGGSDCSPLTQRDYVNLLITACSEVPGTIIALAASAYLERRRMLQMSAGLAGGFTLLLMLSSLAPRSAPLLVSLLFFARGSAVVTINISNIYAPEALPTRVRALGVGLIQLMGKSGCILTPLVAQVVLPVSREAGLVVYAAACAIVVLLATFCLSRETKDADLEDH